MPGSARATSPPAGGAALYEPIARFYDLDHAGVVDDLPLYAEFARAGGGPILDVGVGTGRVALPLAQAGFAVLGVDPSPAMLRLARRRAAAAGVGDRLRLLVGEAATFEDDERFALAYFALNTLSHLLGRPAQLRALTNVRRHLRPGGRLVIDQWNPHASTAPDSSGQWVYGYRRQAADGHWVTQSVASSADNAAQVLQTTITYDEEVPPATHRSRSRRPPGAPGRAMVLRRTVVTLPLRFFYRFEVEWLLLAAGFALETVFGSYDLETYAAGSPRLIWLARTEA